MWTLVYFFFIQPCRANWETQKEKAALFQKTTQEPECLLSLFDLLFCRTCYPHGGRNTSALQPRRGRWEEEVKHEYLLDWGCNLKVTQFLLFILHWLTCHGHSLLQRSHAHNWNLRTSVDKKKKGMYFSVFYYCDKISGMYSYREKKFI